VNFFIVGGCDSVFSMIFVARRNENRIVLENSKKKAKRENERK
jgi:hypothetical protein